MRSEVRHLGGVTIIADCYNANPESMHAALQSLECLVVQDLFLTETAFHADVVLYEWPVLEILWSQEDRGRFGSLRELTRDVRTVSANGRTSAPGLRRRIAAPTNAATSKQRILVNEPRVR